MPYRPRRWWWRRGSCRAPDHGVHFRVASLHFVGVHGGECVGVALSGADADDRLELLHEDLAVAHFTGAGGGEDGLDGGLEEWLGDGHLDLHLVAEFEDEGGA